MDTVQLVISASTSLMQAQFVDLLVAVTPLVRDLLIGTAKAVDNQVSSDAPLTKSETQTPKLTPADRRISMGLTKRDNKLAVALLVEKDESSAERKAEHLASEAGNSIAHLVTGVAQSSKVERASSIDFDRQIGASVGHIRGYPGSLGCFVSVKSKAKDYLAFTSAAHVLSMLNRARKGDPVLFPGHPDGPRILGNKVGTLEDYTFLNHYNDELEWENLLNDVDVAVVKLVRPNDWPDTNLVPDPTEPNRRKRIRAVVEKDQLVDYLGKKVFKSGRTTQLTAGLFEVCGATQYAIRLPDGKVYMYRDLLLITGEGDKPFSEAGDSGALVYTEDFKALGFVVGASGSHTYVCSAAQCLTSVKAVLV